MAGPVRLAPDGVWQAAASPRRWWALTPPFHPYLGRLRRCAGAVSSLFHFPSAFAACLAAASCPSVSGLSSTRRSEAGAAVTRPARRILARSSAAPPRRRAGRRTPGRRRARPRVHDELAADEALERDAAQQRDELLVERAGEGERRQWPSQLPEDPDDAAEDLDVVGVDRLERAFSGCSRMRPCSR